jgi:hypothetical protein
MNFINHLPSPSSSSFTLPLPQVTHTHTVPVLQSWLSLLTFKSMFKGFIDVSPLRVHFSLIHFNPFHYSLLPLYLPLPIFQQLSVHILISSTVTDVRFYDITDALSFSLPFPPSPSSIELLKAHSTQEFVYDHACFGVYVYLSDLSSTYERKHFLPVTKSNHDDIKSTALH